MKHAGSKLAQSNVIKKLIPKVQNRLVVKLKEPKLISHSNNKAAMKKYTGAFKRIL